MRMIEQLAACLAGALSKKAAGNHTEALFDVNAAATSILGVDVALLDTLSAADIAALLGVRRDASLGSAKCLAAAEMLRARGEIQEDTKQGAGLAEAHFRKALSLYIEGLRSAGPGVPDLARHRENAVRTAEKLGISVSMVEEELRTPRL